MAPPTPKLVLLIGLLAIAGAVADNTLPRYSDSSEEQPTAQALKGSRNYKDGFPKTFDARTYWPSCPSIGTVQDQGCCYTGYTIVPTSVMSDRSCIASNGTQTTIYSAFHPLVCCEDCAYDKNQPCLGGDPEKTFNFWVSDGIATGGSYGTSVGCLPYPFLTQCFIQECPKQCNPNSKMAVIDSITKGTKVYKVSPLVSDIQSEIYTHGPVMTTIKLFDDLVNFKGADVYKSSSGTLLGELHIKLIGWGQNYATNEEYWIAINNFGKKWGDSGVFKIVRGSDHLGVESNVITGS